MKKLNKMCKCIISVFCVIVFIVTGSVVRVKGASIGRAVSYCVTKCGNMLGAAGLTVYWDYNDDEYVGPEDYAALYVPKDNNGSVCSFSAFRTNDYSNGWSYVQCNYLAFKDGCFVQGELYASCNTYGEYDNWGKITAVWCNY